MVATVLRLRYRILGNTLSRNPWQLVGFCIGVLSALAVLAGVAAAMIAISFAGDLGVARTVSVLGGSALIIGWVVGPIMIAGMDSSVDAARLAPFPFSTRQVLLALAAAGATGVPGIATTLAALTTAVLWVRWPLAMIVAIPCALLGVATCVIAGRLVATLSTGLGGNRRGREIVGTIVLALLIMTGPIITGVLALLDSAVGLGARLTQAAQVLGFTPLGAAWSVPADIADGHWLGVVVKFAIAVATPFVLWVVWARAHKTSIAAPARQAARTVRPGALGLFARMPATPVGATWARSLRGWTRDPRYLRQLLIVPLLPALFAFTGGVEAGLFTASAVIVSLILSIACYSDISYDGTAFASVLSSGIRGRDDRLGRLLGAASVGVPLVVVIAVVTTSLAGAQDQLPTVLGAALGFLCAGYAVTAVSSALLVSPVAAPGDSPFKSVPGQTFLSGLMVFVVMAAIVVIATPSLVLAVIALTSEAPVFAWITLVVGIGVGVVAIVIGVIVGGRTLDRTGPDLLQRIKAFPTS